jgi:hypothetical protein
VAKYRFDRRRPIARLRDGVLTQEHSNFLRQIGQ